VTRRGALPLGLVAVLVGGAWLGPAACAPASSRRASLLSPCPPGEGPDDALCGRVEVFEDRAAASGRRLALRVVVLPALSRDPRPDPLFILAGGPGQAATRLVEGLSPLLQRVQELRDVVLVDQRGTGDSAPLDCDVSEGLRDEIDAPAVSLETLKACLAGYDADPRLYTTPIAVDDLDQVREALGYERIDLWGGSYGTRVGLVALRRHPDRVRAAVLDGVAPTGMRLPLYFARDGERALDLLLGACEERPDCAAAFPDLRRRSRALLEELDRRPRRVEMVHPRTGAALSVRFDREIVASVLRSALYSGEVASLVPLMLDRADRGDYGPLAAILGMAEGVKLSGGMMLSVLCAEDVPWIDDAEAEAATRDTFLGDVTVHNMRQACSVWPRGELPPGYRDPVVSDRPVLLLSGELDPVTPPVWAEQAAAHLSASRHVVVPGTGHGTSTRGCVPERIAEFLERGSAEGIDFDCVRELRRPPFFLSPAGPVAPEARAP